MAAAPASPARSAPSSGSRRWVCLDVGETLVDETRVWCTWADLLGVPRFTFLGAMGGAIAQDGDHILAFELLDVDDWTGREQDWAAAYGGFRADDLYPDALACLAALRERGYGVAVVANQPAGRHDELLRLGVDVDVLAMSDALGVRKPDPAFFDRILELCQAPAPGDVAYVGDRVDNDVEPARAAGMRAVWLRRGPWGVLGRDETSAAHLVVRTLDELVDRVGEAWA